LIFSILKSLSYEASTFLYRGCPSQRYKYEIKIRLITTTDPRLSVTRSGNTRGRRSLLFYSLCYSRSIIFVRSCLSWFSFVISSNSFSCEIEVSGVTPFIVTFRSLLDDWGQSISSEFVDNFIGTMAQIDIVPCLAEIRIINNICLLVI
jgi:hypothetical protein